MRARLVTAVAGLLVLTGCGDGSAPKPVVDPKAPRSITVSSPDFADGEPIPSAYTCRGKGLSPELHWSGVPADSQVAVVVDDPDAPDGDFVHWVVVAVPPTLAGFDAGGASAGATELKGSGGSGWTAPCPPSGTHHYRFTVYALPASETFAVEGGSVTDFVSVLAGEALAWGRLTGTVTAAPSDGGGY